MAQTEPVKLPKKYSKMSKYFKFTIFQSNNVFGFESVEKRVWNERKRLYINFLSIQVRSTLVSE